MEQKERTNNKGFLTEKYVSPEKIYSRGSVVNPSTLQGTFEVNGFKYRIDGWHTIDEDGLLYVKLQAYPKSTKEEKWDTETKRKYRGVLQEVPDTTFSGERKVCDRYNKIPLAGSLKLSGYKFNLSGRGFITKRNRLSIEFLIFAPPKKK